MRQDTVTVTRDAIPQLSKKQKYFYAYMWAEAVLHYVFDRGSGIPSELAATGVFGNYPENLEPHRSPGVAIACDFFDAISIRPEFNLVPPGEQKLIWQKVRNLLLKLWTNEK